MDSATLRTTSFVALQQSPPKFSKPSHGVLCGFRSSRLQSVGKIYAIHTNGSVSSSVSQGVRPLQSPLLFILSL